MKKLFPDCQSANLHRRFLSPLPSAALKADREQGFDFTSAPLIRIALVQLETDTFQFILSHHHLVLYGWSLAIVLEEVFAFYQAFSQGEELHLKRPRPYRDYIAWLHQQDLSAAESFWRQTLKGFAVPTAIARGNIVAGNSLDRSQIVLPFLSPSSGCGFSIDCLPKTLPTTFLLLCGCKGN